MSDRRPPRESRPDFISPTKRDGLPSHAFDKDKLEIYLFPERFHFDNGGWVMDFRSPNNRTWLHTVPKAVVERINMNFPGGVKPRAGPRFATLRFASETDFVLFGMRYVLGEEIP